MTGTKVKDSASAIMNGCLEIGVIVSEAQLQRKLKAFEERRSNPENPESLVSSVAFTLFGERMVLQRVEENGELKQYTRIPEEMPLLLQFAHRGNGPNALKRN
jgi:hypothetical protein